MALVSCRECKSQVSDQAPACPYCGVAQPGWVPQTFQIPQQPSGFPPLPAKPKAPLVSTTQLALLGIFGVLVAVGLISRARNGGESSYSAPAKEAKPKKESSVLGGAKVACVPTGVNTAACSVTATGVGSTKACWDVVAICDGTRHEASRCSSKMASGATESHAVSFSPPITANCETMRVENITFE